MKLSKENYLKARDFILSNARMIERRLFQFYFENDDPRGVFHAVYAYRNADGVLCRDITDQGWGLYEKPHSLCYAPSPDNVLHAIFSTDTIDTDLNALITRQQEDGRWDTWYGLSEGMKLEWAGIQTLWTLKVLKNYHRIE